MTKLGKRARAFPGQDDGPLVREFVFDEARRLPLVMEATVPDISLQAWLQAHKGYVNDQLLQYGAVLFRGFGVADAAEFEGVVKTFGNRFVEYDFGSTPRTQLRGNLYTSTEYPADQEIALHNEMAYSKRWPRQVWFYCHQPSPVGGETPLADSRKVYQRLDHLVRQRFEEDQLLYVRNYHKGVDVPWQQVFQTEDRRAVEAYCRTHGIDCQWLSPEHLQTRERCPAVMTHPVTGEEVWFNQAHLFHLSNLNAEVRNSLLALLGEKAAPRNVYWGNGTPISDQLLDEVREVLKAEKVAFPWAKGDVLLVDNLLAAHGRHPYAGSRKIMVAMTA